MDQNYEEFPVLSGVLTQQTYTTIFKNFSSSMDLIYYEDNDIASILKIIDEVDRNEKASKPDKKTKHVGVQTDPEIQDVYVPWLLEADRKTDKICVQLCNLVNTLYHSPNSDSKTKNKASPSSAIPIIKKSQICGFPTKPNVPNFNSQSSGCTKLPDGRTKNLGNTLLHELIEDRVDSILESAKNLKNSIPKVSSKQLEKFRGTEYELLESNTMKETNILKIEKSKSSVAKREMSVPQIYKTNRKLSTINESKLAEKRQIHKTSKQLSQMSCGTAKSENMYAVPKTKNVINARNTAPGTSCQPCNAQAQQIHLQDLKLPTKETGAIPKTRKASKITSTNSTVKSQKGKKTNAKPLWK